MSIGLPQPVIHKFFSHKIESSNSEWADYLLEISNVFSLFDGEELDREELEDQFRVISNRSAYTLRDPSNFRDEFGAYGSYLGVYRVEKANNSWYLHLTNAARKYLCTSEPDVQAFCRAQLSLFQYPNGVGVDYRQGNTAWNRVQGNVLLDTIKEVKYGLKIAPFRLLLRALFAKSEAFSIPLEDTIVTYNELFALFNDPRTNKTPIPSSDDIVSVFNDVSSGNYQKWVYEKEKVYLFKRNFHILEHTGIISRVRDGMKLVNSPQAIEWASTIASINLFYTELNDCINTTNVDDNIKKSILGPGWGRYYDAANLPVIILEQITGESSLISPPIVNQTSKLKSKTSTASLTFPNFKDYQINTSRGNVQSVSRKADPEHTRILKERANREHVRLVDRVASIARLKGATPLENEFIDLFVNLNGKEYIFEMKSCNPNNLLSQVRRGVSQLYEYRFRSKSKDAVLVLVLQQAPHESWLIDYLVKDRGIQVMWLMDGINFEAPNDCTVHLAPFLP